MTAINLQRKRGEELKEQFSTVRDRLRLKTHLLGLEGKEAIDHLQRYMQKAEARLADFTEGVSQEADEARLQAYLGLMEARDRLEDVKEEIALISGEADEAAQAARAFFDHARLKAHLAKLEAQDRWREKRKAWKLKYQRMPRSEESDQALDSMDTMMKQLCKEMPR